MASLIWLAVGPVFLRWIIYAFLNVCPFDYTAFEPVYDKRGLLT